MKKVLAFVFALATATSGSLAQSAADDRAAVVVTTTNAKLQLYVAPQASVATVRLLDPQGRLLYIGKQKLAAGLRQTFNLAQLEPGTYRLSVATAGQTVNRTVVVASVPARTTVTLDA